MAGVDTDDRPMTYMEKYEAKQYMSYLDNNYQQALRKSGKGCAGKTLGPIMVLALCLAVLIACPLVLYAVVKNCFFPSEKDEKDGDGTTTLDTVTMGTDEADKGCSTGYGAGVIIAILASAALSVGLAFVCHRIYKRYAAEEHIIHSGAAKIRVDGSKSAPGENFIISIPESYHMQFLSGDNFAKKMDDKQSELLNHVVAHAWYEPDANDENRSELNDVFLSDYRYTIQNPIFWQKFQEAIGEESKSRREQSGYINMDCFGQEFDMKSVLTHEYISNVEAAFATCCDQTLPRFASEEGLFFIALDMPDIIPILKKGLPLKKGYLGKAVYLYDNLKNAILKPTHQLYGQPKCLLLVRAGVRNVCTITKGQRPKKSVYKGFSVAVVEDPKERDYGREFAFFDAKLCVPLAVVVYRRKFKKELQITRQALLKRFAESVPIEV